MTRFLLLMLPLTLGGCVVASEKPAFDTRLIVAATAPGIGAGAPPVVLAAPPNPCLLADPANITAPDRDACIYRIKSSIDDAYLDYRLHIAKEVGLTNEGLDVGSVASSAAATATTGAATKALSGLATLLTGTRTAFNNDALYQQTLQALFKQMDADRSASWANIQISMQSDATVYVIPQAENDLLGYFRAGTIEDALSTLDATAGTASTTCKAASNAVGAARKAANGLKGAAGAAPLVQPPGSSNTSQQPAATTTSEQCSQIVQSANNTLATVKAADVAEREAAISKQIKAVGPKDKATLDRIAEALGAPITADYATERGGVLMALRAIDDPDKLTATAARLNAEIGEASPK